MPYWLSSTGVFDHTPSHSRGHATPRGCPIGYMDHTGVASTGGDPYPEGLPRPAHGTIVARYMCVGALVAGVTRVALLHEELAQLPPVAMRGVAHLLGRPHAAEARGDRIAAIVA